LIMGRKRFVGIAFLTPDRARNRNQDRVRAVLRTGARTQAVKSSQSAATF
jgi:hypothetical protein